MRNLNILFKIIDIIKYPIFIIGAFIIWEVWVIMYGAVVCGMSNVESPCDCDIYNLLIILKQCNN